MQHLSQTFTKLLALKKSIYSPARLTTEHKTEWSYALHSHLVSSKTALIQNKGNDSATATPTYTPILSRLVTFIS